MAPVAEDMARNTAVADAFRKRWHLLVKIALIFLSLIVTLAGIVFVGVMLSAEGGVDAGLWMTLYAASACWPPPSGAA